MKTQVKYNELRNTCNCQDYVVETDTWEDSTYCNGCFEDELDFMKEYLGKWYKDNEGGWWRVEGLPLWNRQACGVFQAHTMIDFVRGITVNGEWRLRYRLNGDVLEAILSHHDCPTGGAFTVAYGQDPNAWIYDNSTEF